MARLADLGGARGGGGKTSTPYTSPAPHAQSSRYWLSVNFLPVMPALRAQLNLPEREGLLVEVVRPESPAARDRHPAIRRVAAGRGQAARRAWRPDSSTRCQRGRETEDRAAARRKSRTIEVVPSPRPEDLASAMARPAEPSDWDTIQQWMEGMWGRENGQIGPGQIRFAQPVRISRPLPPDMSVVVNKRGDQPAKITVEREASRNGNFRSTSSISCPPSPATGRSVARADDVRAVRPGRIRHGARAVRRRRASRAIRPTANLLAAGGEPGSGRRRRSRSAARGASR